MRWVQREIFKKVQRLCASDKSQTPTAERGKLLFAGFDAELLQKWNEETILTEVHALHSRWKGLYIVY